MSDIGAGLVSIKAAHDWLEQYMATHDVISFPIADGLAPYEGRGNTFHHIPVLDAHHAHPVLLRGVTKGEVDEMLDRDRRIRSLFSQRRHVPAATDQSKGYTNKVLEPFNGTSIATRRTRAKLSNRSEPNAAHTARRKPR